MNVEWTETAFNKLSKIKSKHFHEIETDQYVESLVLDIEQKILSTGTLFPSKNYNNQG